MSDDRIAQIIDLIRSIESDGYRRGHNDALSRIVAAAKVAGLDEGEPDSMDPAAVMPTTPGRTAKRAPRGSVHKFVDQVLAHPDYRGANYDAIIESVWRLGGTEIAAASIRNYLRSAEKDHKVRRQGDLWFLPQPPWAREGERRADGQPGESQPE
jgi:hypothetical protein